MIGTVKAVRSIEIPDVKVYEAQGTKLSNITKGTLEVLYIAEYDRFILKINSFQYLLSTSLPVMASLVEQRAFLSYILPSVRGYYLLKLKSNPPPAVIQNFETILSNASQFSYKPEDQKLLTTLSDVGKENVLGNKKPEMTYGDYLKKGGELLKQNIIKAAYYVDKNMNTTNKTYITTVKSLAELKGAMPGQQYIDYPGAGVSKLINISNEIQEVQQLRNQNLLQRGQPLNQNTKGWDDIKTATASSAKSIWAGMSEAGGIISKAFENRKKNKNADKVNDIRQQKVIYDQRSMQNMATDFENFNLVESTQGFQPIAVDTKPQIVHTNPTVVVTNEPTKIHNYPSYQCWTAEEPNYFAPTPEEYNPDSLKAQGNIYPYLDPAPGYPGYYKKAANQNI